MSLEEQDKTKHAGSAADVRRIDGKDLRSDGCAKIIWANLASQQPNRVSPGLKSVRPAPPLGCCP